MRPASGVSNPATSRSKVLLPQPEGPRSAKNSPRFTDSDTRSTACTAPNRFSTSMMSRSAIRSAAGFAPAPQPGAQPLIWARRRRIDVEQPAHRFRRVDAGIVADFGLHISGRGQVRVRIGYRVADCGDHLRPQDMVDKPQRVLGMRRVGRDAEHVDRHLRPLTRYPERDLDPALDLCGAVARLNYIPAIAERDAQIAGRQIGDVLRRMELAPIGPDPLDQLGGAIEIGEIAAFRIELKIGERRREHLLRGVE